jgi:hypothetical protein
VRVEENERIAVGPYCLKSKRNVGSRKIWVIQTVDFPPAKDEKLSIGGRRNLEGARESSLGSNRDSHCGLKLGNLFPCGTELFI